jgi:TatD DNase family protein
MKSFNDLIAEGILFDSHCHLSYLEQSELAVENAVKSGVEYVVDVAIDVQSAERSIQRQQSTKGITLATVGIHPEYLIPGTDIGRDKPWDKARIADELDGMSNLLAKYSQQIAMVGECGLDWYWLEKAGLNPNELVQYKSSQIELFEKQIILAIQYDLPITIHTRDSFAEAINLIKKYPKARAVFHSFTGNYEQTKAILDLGMLVGVNGIITYKSAVDIRESIVKIMGRIEGVKPLDFYCKGLLFETDSPYLRPSNAKISGKQNLPETVADTFRFVSKLIAN